jgi:hypothetical protein
MRDNKQDGRNSDGTGYRIIKGRFGWKRFFQNRRGFVHDISRIGVATAMSVGGRSKGVHCIELFSGCPPPMSGLVRLALVVNLQHRMHARSGTIAGQIKRS